MNKRRTTFINDAQRINSFLDECELAPHTGGQERLLQGRVAPPPGLEDYEDNTGTS